MRASSESTTATPAATIQPATPASDISSWEELLLDDVEQIIHWSDRVLENPDAPRLAVFQAHAARVGALQHVWFWSTYIAPDEDRSTAAAEEYRQAVTDSIAFGEIEPLELDEIPSMRLIYFSAQSLAMFLDDDQEAAAELESKIADITSREMSERVESTTNLLTTCNEVRETAAGDAAANSGDATEAMARYDAALRANPDHVAALLGAGKLRLENGDIEGAITMAERATGISTSPYAAWADLALYRTASGDIAGARDAYDRFFTLLADAGPQVGMFAIEQAIDELEDLLEDEQIDAAAMRESLSLFAPFLDAMADETTGSYQYAALYARLGNLALRVDSPEDAETWLRHALELDPHQPAVYSDLVVALAIAGDDPDAVIAMAIDEAQDPLWTATVDYGTQWVLDEMEDEAVSLREAFPDQAPALDAFVNAIDEARSQP
jgi:tetratricopeptide (TPR) repeat protein